MSFAEEATIASVQPNEPMEKSAKVNDPDLIDFDGPDDPLNPLVSESLVTAPVISVLEVLIYFIAELVSVEEGSTNTHPGFDNSGGVSVQALGVKYEKRH